MQKQQKIEFKKWVFLSKQLTTTDMYYVSVDDLRELNDFIFDNQDTFKIISNKRYNQSYWPTRLVIKVITPEKQIIKVFLKNETTKMI